MAIPQQITKPDEIVSEIRIAAPRERVFKALVDPSQVVQWWVKPAFTGARNSRVTCGSVVAGVA